MAKEIIETLIDDLDGSPATSTVRVGLDGLEYTVDLSDKNNNALRTALNPFLEGARRVRNEPRGSTRGSRSVSDKEQNAQIRDWALSEGVELPTRGRIANAVRQAYEAQDGDALREAVGVELVEEEPVEDKPRRRRKADAEFSEAAA